MKLSSLDIRKQQFSRIVRGYDRDEVDAFLDMVGTQWQELVDEMRRAEDKLKEMQVQLDHYQKVEEALEEAIKGARSSAERKIETAEKSATAILEKAEARSVKITMDAENDRLKIKRETAKYSIRQKEMLSKFKAFLNSELEMLAYHENEARIDVPPVAAQLAEASILNGDLEDEELDVNVSEETDLISEEKTDEAGSDGDAESENIVEDSNEDEDEDESSAAIADHAESEAEVSDGDAEGEIESAPEGEIESAPEGELEPEMSSDSVNGESDDSVTSLKHRKPSWTVNTLVSPEDSRKSEDRSEPDRDAAEPTGDMRAAQEEIDNLRKLLKDLE